MSQHIRRNPRRNPPLSEILHHLAYAAVLLTASWAGIVAVLHYARLTLLR